MNILAVHNHPEFVESLSAAINYSSHQQSKSYVPNIIEAHNLAEALSVLTDENSISLVLISMELADSESSTWMTAIRSHQPLIPILFVSDVVDREAIAQVVSQETVSCPFNTPSGRIVLNAIIKGVSNNFDRDARTPEPQAVKQTPLTGDTDTETLKKERINELQARLTPRQQDVLELLKNGYSNKEIARLLTLAEGTVKIHCLSIYRRLGVTNRTQAAREAN